MLFLEGPLKLDFSEIYLTMFLGVSNLGNTSAIRVTFFLENVQNLM